MLAARIRNVPRHSAGIDICIISTAQQASPNSSAVAEETLVGKIVADAHEIGIGGVVRLSLSAVASWDATTRSGKPQLVGGVPAATNCICVLLSQVSLRRETRACTVTQISGRNDPRKLRLGRSKANEKENRKWLT
jgi:hypothetical protein